MFNLSNQLCKVGFSLFKKQRMLISTTNFDKVFTENHTREYLNNGATLVENVLNEQEIDEMIQQTQRLVNQNDIFKKIVFFRSGEESRGLDFLETGDKIHFFFEHNIFDENQKLKVPQEHALNKIGHAMHDIDPYYEKFSYQPLYRYILKQIGYKEPTLVQSMYIYKNPEVGAEVCPHTDNTYIITEPKLSCVGFWFALHDATIENGCMWGVSGSQTESTQRFMYRNEANNDVTYEGTEKQYQLEKAVPLEVKKGSMLVFSGDYVHYSEHNKSKFPRHALTFHFVETADGIKWHKRNWLQRNQNLPFRDYNKTVSSLQQ